MKKLFLVDAYALIYRMYYAFLSRPMRNAAGVNTSPVFGFVKFLREVIRRENPHYLGVAFDSKGATFRHEMFPAYKANRAETPEDIHAAVPYIKKVLEAMRIPILEQCGWEADDIIGTMSCKACEVGFHTYMVTPDKDFGQLVNHCVSIYKQRKSGEGIEIIGPEQIKEQYQIDNPKLLIDILAIWGDASDNIPGVPGIGEKGAIKLVSQYGTVENILANIDQLGGKQKESILANAEQLKMSKVLATIDIDAPVEFDPKALELEPPDAQALLEVFRELGFNMFIREIEAGMNVLRPHGGQLVETKEEAAVVSEPTVDSGQKEFQSPVTPQRKEKSGMQGQGSLFDMFGAPAPAAPQTEPAASMQGDLFADEGYDSVETLPHKYHTVKEADELRALAEKLAAAGEFCFDTETRSFDVFADDCLVGVSFCTKPHEAWYVPFDGKNREEFTKILKPLFENERVSKVGQNLKFDIMALANAGIDVKGFKYDTMILHYLLDPESRHGMNYLARTYLNYAPIPIENLIGKGAKQLTMDMVPLDRIAEYGAEDADVTMRLKEALWPKVEEEGLAELYRNIEEPIIDVLADMELTGVKIDSHILSDYGKELQGQLDGLERQIRDIAEEPGLNVNSAKQLGETLFGRMKIDPKPKMTKTKQYSTDEEYLQSLTDRSPIIGLILEYRGIKKLLSTYIDALPLLVNPKTGRIHTSYNQAVTATGRLSSSNPNLQNIPIRDQAGREIRKAFIPSDSDRLLFSADYSQVELRLMAHLSGDRNLLEAFEKGEDIHAATASLLFGVPLPEVTSEQRRRAKTANFGIIYGISAFGLSQRLNIPRGEAKEIIEGYFRSYPGVKDYMEKVTVQAREDGYVTTIFGRKRWLRDINSRNVTARGLAERNAINAPLQGSAADIMKIAMITVHREFAQSGLQSKVIMQVHDELVVDMCKHEREQVAKIVVDAMENAAKLKVALTVDYGIGDNWLAAH